MATPTEGNIRRAEEQLEAYNRRDVTALVDVYREDAVLTDHALQQTVSGREAIRAYFQAQFDASSDVTFESARVVGADDWTMARGETRGTHDGPWAGIAPTNRPFAASLCSVGRWENGQVIEDHFYYDLYGVLAQLGQVPDLTTSPSA
jgi:steroid delta-isomerase-like uncharacterized protein